VKNVKRKNLGRRILSVILSVALVLGLMPEMLGSKMVVQAAENREPAVTAYATKDQLMNTFQQDGNNSTIGKIVFGKNYEGNPQEWYILGKDTGVSGDNIAVFATSFLSGNQSFRSSRDDVVYTSDMGAYSSPPSHVFPNHYGSSALRNTLRTLATNTDYFTTAEQDLMQATTVTTRDVKNDTTYTVTDVLYAVSAGNLYNNRVIYAGANNDKVLKTESFWNIWYNVFWLRDPAYYYAGIYEDYSNERDYAYVAGNGTFYESIGQVGVRPATNINMTNVVFASVAKAAQSGTEVGTIPAGTAMTLRLDGSNRNIGSVTYSTESDNIVVTRGNTTGPVSLVVQGNDGTNDWYYSKAISENTTVNVTDIEAALASNGISDVKLLNCKIWLETTINGLAYAVTAETTNPYNEPVCADGVYQISSVQDLCWFALSVNRGLSNLNAKLTADLDLTGVNWTQMESFSGTFDGDGHTISGLNGHADNDDTSVKGFIATVDNSGVIKNLTFDKAKVFNNEETNGSSVIACTNNGRIENCRVINSTIQLGARLRLGVVVGENKGTIVNCASVSNTVHRRFGKALDVCGFSWSNSGTIENCYTYDCTYKSGVNRYAFTQSNTGTISNCYYYEPSETLSDTVPTQKTKEQFASGEVCHLLNGSKSTGDLTWGQTLGTDSYPLFKTENDLVCKNPTEEVYSNHNQFNEAGFCVTCGGGYEKPELIDGVYQIANVGQLCWFEKYVNSGNQSANAKLTVDIDMTNISWTTICETALYYNGYGAECDNGYSGTFDGDGHVISNLTVTSSADAEASVGLFGTVSGTVKNLGLENFTLVDGGKDMRAGAIVGQLIKTGKVSDCYVKGADIQTGDHVAGGIAGCVYEGTVENCYVVDATISGANGRFGYVTGDVCADGNSGDGTDRPGVVKNCFTDESALTSTRKGVNSVVGGGAGVSEERFASGEVACLLNGSTSTGDLVWYQNLGGTADAYPVLDATHSKVYGVYKYDCPLDTEGQLIGFNSNAEEESRAQDHTFVDNRCVICGLKGTITIAPVNGGALTEAEYEFANGVHTIKTDRAVIISGITTTETVVVASGVNANITLNGVDIDVSSTRGACAFKIEDNSTGNVTITLADGTKNILKSGENRAGLQKNGEYISDTQGKLTIQGGTKGTGKLTATGGYDGAGIGGGFIKEGSNITISGAVVEAIGGYNGAGIGGCNGGAGKNITISGGTVTATGGYDGAGIGGSDGGAGTNITISGGTVTATSGRGGAGIGGGHSEDGKNITISGGTVTATGGKYGAGIGGGNSGVGSGITISGGTVTATGGEYGAGIGGGDGGAGTNITISGGSVKPNAGVRANAIGGGTYQSATTPTLADKTTPVYLFEIDNAESTNIVINDKDYPDAHGTEKKIYAYLPAKSDTEPNVIHVGKTVTRYYYDAESRSWIKTCGSGNHVDTDNNCACDNCAYTYAHTDENDDGHCDRCNRVWVPAVDSNGDGVYEIGNANQLYWFAAQVNAGNKAANAELTADIDFSGWDFSTDPWTPICQTISFHEKGATVTDTGYTGTFNGKGHTITGLTVTGKSGATCSYGLFGTVSGTIKNLGMVNFVYTMENAGDTRAGSVAGQLLNGGSITDCYSVGHSIKTNNNIAGGIAGCNYGGTVRNCYALNGTVTGYETRWGGVVGDCQDDGGADAGTVTNCYTDATRVVSIQNTEANITNCKKEKDEAFASGEIAYLLNESTSGGTTWYQTLSGDSADSYPVLNSASGTVYRGFNACKAVYANDNTGFSAESPKHSWADSKCTVCGEVCTTHAWENGACTVCGCQYVKDITIKLADGTVFGEGEYTFNYDTEVHTINTTKDVTISGTTKSETIVVSKDVSANITLAGVSIDVSGTNDACALEIEGNGTGTVTITLADETTNELKSGYRRAGLETELESGYENKRHLIITGTGALTATGGSSGAGIGGGNDGAGGTITINGGTVTATGGTYGAGIGGGDDGAGGTITINGGTVTATGVISGAGIGGGYGGAGGTITINGGTVTATGGTTGADIGGGYGGAEGTITINGGNVKSNKVKGTLQNGTKESLYLHTIVLNGITSETEITSIVAGAEYGLNDVKTLDTNKLYFYLPITAMPYEVDIEEECYYGKLIGDTAKEGTFYKVSFEKRDDTTLVGNGDISTIISIAEPTNKEYTGNAIEAVVADSYNDDVPGMIKYKALVGSLTPVVTMVPAPTSAPSVEPSAEPSVAPSVEPSVAPSFEPSVEPSLAPESTDSNESAQTDAPEGTPTEASAETDAPKGTPTEAPAEMDALKGTPTEAPAEIQVTRNLPVNKGKYEASITLDGKVISVVYDITRTPSVSDFTFIAPDNEIYDTTPHQVFVESKSEGIGKITILYYDENGDLVDGIPVNAGTYTVKIRVTEGEIYSATEITDDNWTFTIGKRGITITAEDKSACVESQKPAFTYQVSGLLEDDTLITEPVMDATTDMTKVGVYEIIPQGAEAGSNYSITYVPGKLTLVDHVDTDNDHVCDNGCDVVQGTCTDTDKDHKCDYGCDKVQGTCTDAEKDGDHSCDYGCGKTLTTCSGGTATCVAKATCEECGKEYGNTDASNHTGRTEVRNASAAKCATEGYTGDTYCKDCGVKLEEGEKIPATGHKDADKDHVCDNGCDVVQGTCADTDKDHKCDYGCSKVFGTCEDTDKDHACDYGCDKVHGTCTDAEKDGDHSCDYGCGKVLTTCSGGTATCVAKATCEECGKEYGNTDASNHTGRTEVRNTSAAKCATEGYTGDTYCKDCGVKLEEGEKIPATGHKDADKDHVCDNGCGLEQGNCEDGNKDHKCDLCDKILSECTDSSGDGDHSCDYGCGKNITTCSGGTATCKDKAVCEECGKEYGNTDASNHTGRTEVRNASAAKCATEGYTGDTHCKDCGVKLEEGEKIPATGHKDADKDHVCDNGCDVVQGTCADTDKDHKCDYGCSKVFGTCEDTDKDHACDYGCDKVHGTCTDAEKDGDHSCDYGCGKVLTTCSGGTATCVAKATCEECGKEYGSVDINNHIGKTLVLDAVPANCTEEGYTGDTYCKDCGVKLQAGQKIPTTEHTDEDKNQICDDCQADLSTPSEPTFVDVKENQWHYSYVNYVVMKGIMSGKKVNEDGSIYFDPDNTMTRAEFAQVLYNAEGKPAVEYAEKFADVKNGKWYTNAIMWASEKGIVTGYGNGSFGVSDPITREQLATMLYKYAQYKGYDISGDCELGTYSDNTSISSWAVKYMKWAVANNVMKGKKEKLDPIGNATRAECATMLKNFMDRYEK